MKVYLLKEEDFIALLLAIDRDPIYGEQGGGSLILSDTERAAHVRARGFFNFQIRNWIEKVKK